MPLTVTEDEAAPPGYAIIDLGRRIVAPTVRLSFRRAQNEPRHLGREGWQPEAAYLDVGEVEQAGSTSQVRIGPEIVSWIDELELVEIIVENGPSLGSLAWPSLPRPALLDADILVARERKSDVPPAPPPFQPPPPAVSPPKPPPPPPPPPPPKAVEPPPLPAPAPKPTTLAAAPGSTTPGGEPNHRNLRLLFIGLAVLAAAAGAYFSRDRWGPLVFAQQRPGPVQPPGPNPRDKIAAEIDDLIRRRAPEADIMAAGDKALGLGAGNAAFKAFDEIRKSEEVAWRMARFYDPAETDPAYRQSDVRPNPANAASYYALFKGSQRHREALNKLCLANQSLQATNPEFKKNCL